MKSINKSECPSAASHKQITLHEALWILNAEGAAKKEKAQCTSLSGNLIRQTQQRTKKAEIYESLWESGTASAAKEKKKYTVLFEAL